MGYWGTLIAVRGGFPASPDGSGPEVRVGPGADRGDGWQVFSLPDNHVGRGDDLLPRLAAQSGSPVLAGYIADSDYGWLVGVNPKADRWEAWLDVKTAFAFERDYQVMMGAPKPEAERRARELIQGFGMPPAEAARHAVRWAAEAGYSVTAGPIRQILSTRRPPGLGARLRLPWRRYVLAEEMFFDLLDYLGVPDSSPPSDRLHSRRS